MVWAVVAIGIVLLTMIVGFGLGILFAHKNAKKISTVADTTKNVAADLGVKK